MTLRIILVIRSLVIDYYLVIVSWNLVIYPLAINKFLSLI